MKKLKLLLIPIALLLLASCAPRYTRVYVGVPNNEIIQVFEPGRGQGAIYHLGENIDFRVKTSQTGYLTFTVIDPDGRVYELERNVFIQAGQLTYFPNSSTQAGSLSLVPPRGHHRVRVSFTSSQTDVNRVNYVNVNGEANWNNTIQSDIQYSNLRDVAETWFFIE